MINIEEKLPHKPPVRFIKEVIESADTYAVSLVHFDTSPTLSATVEAAAQNIVFILSVFKEGYMGVLTAAKSVKLHEPPDKGTYRVYTEKTAEFEDFFMLHFTLTREEKLYVSGEISIYREKQ